jgi:copper chaperone CopZ
VNKQQDGHLDPLEKSLDYAAPSNATAVYLSVWGMSCPSCALRVHKTLLSLDGVLTARVFLEQGITAAFYNPECLNLDDLIKAVVGIGSNGRHCYRVELISQMSVAHAQRLINTRASK